MWQDALEMWQVRLEMWQDALEMWQDALEMWQVRSRKPFSNLVLKSFPQREHMNT